MSLTQQRLKKQDLLIQTCKYQRISSNDLLQYLMSVKGDNYNLLDQWEYTELDAAIQQFIQTKSQVKQNSEVLVTQQSDDRVVVVDDENNYREILKCRNIQANQISVYVQQNPTIILRPKVREYKIIDEGAFTPNYVVYKVESGEFDWVVWRRVEAFHWLQDMLTQQFPDSLIPPLPAKTFLRKFEPGHLSKRCKMLELFLSAVLSNQLLRSSELVEGFLMFDDDVKFKQMTVASEVLKKPARYTEYATIEGEVMLEYNPWLNQYFMDMNGYLLASNDVYKEMTDNSRLLVETMKQFSQRVGNLTGNVTRLKEMTQDFDKKTKIGNLCMIEFIYTLLEQYLQQWNVNLQQLTSTINENFYEFFRFQRDMQKNCVDLIDNRNKAQSTYLKESQDLMKKKFKYYANEPIEKWQLTTELDKVKVKDNKELAISLMFPKETQQVEELKQKFAYINRQSYDQISQYFDNKGVVYTVRLGQMSNKKKEHALEHQETVNSIAHQLDQLLLMRRGEREVDLRQEWVDQYYYPLSISNIVQ